MDSLPCPQQDDASVHREQRASYTLMHKHLLKSLDAYAIVLSILLTSSYSGFLQFPKPLKDSKCNYFCVWADLFVYFNGFSLFSSVIGLLLFASNSFSPLLALELNSTSHETEAQRRLELLADTLPKFFYVILFFGISLSCGVLAYVFAGLTTVAGGAKQYCAVFIPAAFGGFVYLQALCVCGRDAWQLISGIRKNDELWEAVQRRTRFGVWLVRYVDFYSRLGGQGQRSTSSLNENQDNGQDKVTTVPAADTPNPI